MSENAIVDGIAFVVVLHKPFPNGTWFVEFVAEPHPATWFVCPVTKAFAAVNQFAFVDDVIDINAIQRSWLLPKAKLIGSDRRRIPLYEADEFVPVTVNA